MYEISEALRHEIKAKNIVRLAEKNYRYIDWLPILEEPKLRSLEELKGRMSVMNAMINISFQAPIAFIKTWIESEGLSTCLSDWERSILEKTQDDLEEIESNTLRWYLEGLWALMWASKMIEDLDEASWVPDHMASMLPNLAEDEDNQKLSQLSEIRETIDIYTMLDYHYRLHWYCVDERINRREARINEGIIYERRRALEWLLNQDSDWDNIEMGT